MMIKIFYVTSLGRLLLLRMITKSFILQRMRDHDTHLISISIRKKIPILTLNMFILHKKAFDYRHA